VSMFARSVLGLVFTATSSLAVAAPVSGQGTWQTTLQARDLDGNGSIDAYYDNALNITWLADASAFNGTWNASKAWADKLVVGAYSAWRLPNLVDVGNNGCTTLSNAGGANTDCGFNVDTRLSELAHMYYETLGNIAPFAPSTGTGNQPGWGLNNTGPFSNIQPFYYWSAVEYAPGTDFAWNFNIRTGQQYRSAKTSGFYAWAVSDGDVGVAVAVPEPESWALALAGLAVAGWAIRRRA
jgi:PEP-CTERM motif